MRKLSVLLVMFASIGASACASDTKRGESAGEDHAQDAANASAADEEQGDRDDAGAMTSAAPERNDAGGLGTGGSVADGNLAGTRDAASTSSDAGGRASARDGASTADLPALQIYSDTATIEFTPALFVAQNSYAGAATVRSGGIANLFNGGGADLATNAETQALRQSAQRPNLRIICTVTETFYRIVARRSAGIAQLADLSGKRVGTVPSTSAHYYLDRMLRTVGLSADDVSLVSAFPLSRMASLLQSQQVDAVTSWEPEPQNAADALGDDLIEFQDRSVYREIVNLHTTSETLRDADKRRGIVAFVRALIQAADTFQNRPEQVWPLVADATGYAPELIAKVWHLERFPGALVDDLLDVLEQEEPWVARQTGRAARDRAQLATLIDASVLEEALAAGP